MLINIDSNKYKDMTLASLHMGLIADRFKKRQSIKDLQRVMQRWWLL